ncbi:protein aurora borealis isoform X2 [Triplophysa rosa]|uniref:Protein aurora borealis n=1 Tax=Triplophysa rosa TaxID=992332 RepID=A0A9W7WZ72_TRIRA|nr:protein aurora borealis isoform X2 [Triplophysa rosa]KAI7811088.1 protein aurora borealis [Triplophysa rosa]
MGDVAEFHITPDTPGRPAIFNPFESPNDYHRLHEPLVPSPSVFKSSRSVLTTPAKFKWSIDEMANLLPVEIDPEDIHRQAVFLSQARADAEIEEKRQNAIDQFFTKGAIVPSPWGPLAAKQSVKVPYQKSSLSPPVTEENSPKKMNVICQTGLSLPVDFNLEKVLGDYYRTEELTEQVQESLSSSSLRRKLFLDGHDSGSESSTPSSPDKNSHNELSKNREMMSSVIVSPLQTGISTAATPLSGQFSSSPIQSKGRAYSLGSVASPLFQEISSTAFKSPVLSPIMLQHSATPISGERKRLSFLSPGSGPMGSSDVNMNQCGESPYVEGCSPIRSFSPLQTRPINRGCMWASPTLISPIFHPNLLDKGNVHPNEPSPTKDLDASSTGQCGQREGLQTVGSECEASMAVAEQMAQDVLVVKDLGAKIETGSEDEEDIISREESCGWVPEENTASPVGLISSRAGSVPNAESTHMFVSLLAEGSITPYEVSMQVDSGYNTHSVCTTSLMDTLSSDNQSKEMLDTHTAEEGLLYARHTKPKLFAHCTEHGGQIRLSTHYLSENSGGHITYSNQAV